MSLFLLQRDSIIFAEVFCPNIVQSVDRLNLLHAGFMSKYSIFRRLLEFTIRTIFSLSSSKCSKATQAIRLLSKLSSVTTFTSMTIQRMQMSGSSQRRSRKTQQEQTIKATMDLSKFERASCMCCG